MKKIFINQIKSGQVVDDIFVVRDKQIAYKKNGDPYLTFTLLDKTGEIKAVAWNRVTDLNDLLTDTTYIKASGKVSEYMGTLQFVVLDIKLASSADVDPKDFLPATEKDVDKMFNRLKVIIAGSIKEPCLFDLVNNFFSDDHFIRAFKAAPAGKKMHHAYIGGLLEHTLTMAEMGLAVVEHIKILNRDLLLTGIILHDIGKIYEYTYEAPPIDYSDEGRLLGHITIGAQMLDEQLKKVGFPEPLAMRLKHLIISHHGRQEWGSPEPPKTLEAVVLHNLDMLDTQIAAVKGFLDQHPEDGWTDYHRILERHFLK